MVFDHMAPSENQRSLEGGITSLHHRFFAWVVDCFVFFPFASLTALPWLKDMRRLAPSDTSTPDEAYLAFLYALTFLFALAIYKSAYRTFFHRTPGERAFGVVLRFARPGHRRHFWSGFWRELFCWMGMALLGFPWIYELSQRKKYFFYERITESYMMGITTDPFDDAVVIGLTFLSRSMVLAFAMGAGLILARIGTHASQGNFSLSDKLENDIPECNYDHGSLDAFIDTELVKNLYGSKNSECLDHVKDILLKASTGEGFEKGLVIGLFMNHANPDLYGEYRRELCAVGDFELCAWATNQSVEKPNLNDEIVIPGFDLVSTYLKITALKNKSDTKSEELIPLYQHLMDQKDLKPLVQREYFSYLVSKISPNNKVNRNNRIPASQEESNGVLEILKKEIDNL